MNPLPRFYRSAVRGRTPQRGSVLIIVLWVAFGLVSLTLYFANSMSFEMRAADNRVAALQAEQAIAGAARYLSALLTNGLETPGTFPDLYIYRFAELPVADATVWFIGRDTNNWSRATTEPVFGLVDEAAKLNLNTATREMLEALPRMTPELAAAILDWRDSDSEVTSGGAEDETYLRRNPAYRTKNARFESVEELRLVAGADLELLYGEDTNLNGVLDPNEDDGDLSPPADNRDGRLDPGLLEYLTVYTREPSTRSDGTPRLNVSTANPQELASLLQEKLGNERANQVQARLGGSLANLTSPLEFYLRSGMTAEEFARIAPEITAGQPPQLEGLVNVNTASEAVLACLPGIGPDHAASLVAYRRSNPGNLTSVAWVAEVLDQANAVQAGPYLTAQSYQFTADIAAVGRYGRGYRRVRYVFDTADGTARIAARQDLSSLGWALGRQARETVRLANDNRRWN